jgi:hypothetical protein
MPNFTGTDSWDFFSLPMSNRVAPFVEGVNDIEIATIQKKLVEGSSSPFYTAISEPATLLDDGTEIESEDVSFPYELQFRSSAHFDDEKVFDLTTGE